MSKIFESSLWHNPERRASIESKGKENKTKRKKEKIEGKDGRKKKKKRMCIYKEVWYRAKEELKNAGAQQSSDWNK